MQRSYLDYAMSVIVQRALPDVRDGLKPVHRRVLYAMYDGGYRPDRGFSKCSRVVGDVMGQYHPHGDTAIYDTLVRLGQPWSLRYPLVQSQGNFGSPGDDRQAAMRYTECRLAPLAMEMVRDIDEETVDFSPNYDGRQQEPSVLPARFPNLLVNGSGGIAVGMATNIPPHNLREVASGVQWHLDNPQASHEELLEALLERIKGPDFPTKGLIVGTRGIEDAYRTGRGSVTMRAVVEVEEDSRGRTMPRHHRAALPGQPGRAGPQDRRARRQRQGAGHRRPARRLVVAHRHAARRRPQARRGRERRAQQPLQAHPAAGHVRLQHAGARRRRAAHAVARRVRPALGDPPDRGHRPAHHASGCAGPRSGRTSCVACSRRSTGSTRSSR